MGISIFVLLEMCLEGKFQTVELLSQKVTM